MNVSTPADLAGLTVGVQISTTGDIAVAKIAGVKEKKTYDDIGLAVEDLSIGRLDAVVVDSPTAAGYVLQNDKYKAKLKIVGVPFTEEYYGIAVKKGDSRLARPDQQGPRHHHERRDSRRAEEEVAAVAP